MLLLLFGFPVYIKLLKPKLLCGSTGPKESREHLYGEPQKQTVLNQWRERLAQPRSSKDSMNVLTLLGDKVISIKFSRINIKCKKL